MKTCIQHLVVLMTLASSIGLMPIGLVSAQTLTNLHNFTRGSDGANPRARLI